MNGMLDEPEWAQAAMLTGFSQFSPMDGVPAADSTEVLVWYAPDAIYFGIRAYEAHGEVHATLADRDKIGADDYVQILLGTFDDSRQATVLSVNPLRRPVGWRAGGDGLHQRKWIQQRGRAAGDCADLSPDFVFESKGRLTDYGYEVEVRIPFKSLRFQPSREQRWGINITRQVQHSGAGGLLGAGPACERVVSRPVRSPRRPGRPAARPGPRLQPFDYLEDHRHARGGRLGLQRRQPRDRRQHSLGHHQ